MENIFSAVSLSKKSKTIILDVLALSVIYIVPAISHMLALPVYFVEPMRLMLIFSLAHTTKRNSYLIALTLPLFSFLVSAHPSLIKSALIAFELGLNVFLFYAISGKIKNLFGSMFLSIALSKVFFYMVKFLLVSFALWSSGINSIPIYFQAVMTVLFSSYIYFAVKKEE